MRAEVHIAELGIELKRQNLLPAIVFRSSRNQCDVDVQNANSSREMNISPIEQRELVQEMDRVMAHYDMDRELILTHPQYNALVKTGVGAHHAGQLLMWRLLLEELMASGSLRILVATGTVAAGVDFPARTVVITAHSRRGAEGFSALTAAEFQQMSGRAGRRGRDTVGFCLAAPAPFCDARMLLRISKQPPEPLVSAYFPGPSTVLNLLRYRNVDDLRYTVSRSLASFLDRRQAVKLREGTEEILEKLPEHLRNLENPEGEKLTREQRRILKRVRRELRLATELERQQEVLLDTALNGLGKLKYLDGMNLSEKGYWAANLCTSLVLELAELIEQGFFDGVSAERLAALIGSICADEHRLYLETKTAALSRDDVANLSTVLDLVGSLRMPGVVEGRQVIPAAANTVITWMHSESWQEFRSLLLLTGAAEGDAARLITQTAEQLNQLTRLYQSHPQLVHKAEEAKRRLLRPPLTEGINLETL